MKRLAFVLGFFFCVHCTTTKRDYMEETITQDTKTKDALEIAVAQGSHEIKNALRLVALREEQEFAKEFLVHKLLSREVEVPFFQKANTLGLLQSFRLKSSEAISLFEKLKASLHDKQRELAWGVATAFPSAEMGVHIEKHLSAALISDDLERELVPAMADALAQNQLVSSYSILREGLFKTHNSAFSQAMMRLDPGSAEKDFLTYLGLIPLEELRQLNLETSDIFLCLELLDFIAKRNPEPTHSRYGSLFHFAISRNQSLSEAAIKVLEKSAVTHRSYLAQILSMTPAWIQLAYIEKSRRNASVQTRLFLKELKNISSKVLVLKEIEAFLQ